jgi:hypothetical protein
MQKTFAQRYAAVQQIITGVLMNKWRANTHREGLAKDFFHTTVNDKGGSRAPLVFALSANR